MAWKDTTLLKFFDCLNKVLRYCVAWAGGLPPHTINLGRMIVELLL